MSNYIDKAVIKLKRQYGKDELVAHLLKKQSELELELGMLRSERDELHYKMQKFLKLKNDVRQRIIQVHYVKKLLEQVNGLRVKCEKLDAENKALVVKVARLSSNKDG
jgi:uncharacterized coiled-coil DUF342 family protein